MKTRDQRRKRRPLGSIFGGQAPQKQSLAGAASCLLPTMVAQLAKNICEMGRKHTCQIWQRYGKKLPKNAQNWPYIIKAAQILANGILFLTFWPQPVVLRGRNTAQFRKQQPIQNSAPNVRRLPEKPLKPPLIHQKDHRRRKKGKVAFLEFDFDHFKGQHGRTLESSEFTPKGGVVYGMDLVFDGASGAPHPDAHQKTTARGGGFELGDEGGDLECGKVQQVASP